jgi:putative nucleotidyltransferase with HDIG domain
MSDVLGVSGVSNVTDREVGAAVEDMVARGEVRVPPYPATALRLQKVLATDDYGVNDLVREMSADPVFTGNILRLANSSFYRRSGEVTSIAAAVSRIGARELTRLAMSASLAQAASEVGPLGELRRRVWREAVASALLCENVARLENGNPGEAFVAGLLHDVGKLLAIGAIEDLLHRRVHVESRPAADWWKMIERHHVRLGVSLAERWQLPGLIGAVIAVHHVPGEEGTGLVRAIHIADAVVGLMESRPEVAPAALEMLGLEPSIAQEVSALIPRVPTFIASFDAESTVGSRESKSQVTPEHPPASTFATPLAGLSIEIVSGAKRKEPWPVSGLSATHLKVQSVQPVNANLLLEVSLRPGGVRFWTVVRSCSVTKDGHEVVLAPFALAPDIARKWAALVETVGPT